MMSQAMSVRQEANRKVKASLQLLPSTLTAAYSIAALQAPALVDTESDPSLYLQSEKDFNKAALKLCMYWSKRYIYYGPRAYLPLNQLNGVNGALSPHDIAALPQACLQQLPQDSQGRAVYWISGNKAVNFQSECDIRCLFYQLQLACNGFSASQGIVLLLLVDEATDLARLNALLSLMSELLAMVMPFYIRHFHILSLNPASQQVSLTISGVVKLAMDKNLSRECSIGAATTAQELLVNKLVPFGLLQQGLPPELGGTYVVPTSTTGATEQAISSAALEAAAAGMAKLAGAAVGLPVAASAAANPPQDRARVSCAPQQPVTAAAASVPQDNLSSSQAQLPPSFWGRRSTNTTELQAGFQEEEQGDRKRKALDLELDKLTDKKKRSKATTAPVRPPSHAEFASSYASHLMNELPSRTASVGGSVAAASAATANDTEAKTPQEIEEAKKKQIRQRNALYSRRKYVRRRIEIEVMEDQRTTLRAENKQLFQEQKRLESLWSMAQQCVEGYKHSGTVARSSSLRSVQQPPPAVSTQKQETPQEPSTVGQQEQSSTYTASSAQQQQLFPSSLVAAVLAAHQQQRQQQQEQGQEASTSQYGRQAAPSSTSAAAAAAAAAAGSVVQAASFAPATAISSVAAASVLGGAPPPAQVLGHLGGHTHAPSYNLGGLLTGLTRSGPDRRGLAVLGPWNPAASLTNSSLNNNGSSSASNNGAIAPAAAWNRYGSQVHQQPFMESTSVFPNASVLPSAGMPSTLLIRPYMQGPVMPPLLPNAHLAPSSEDDASWHEQKKPPI